MPVHHEITGDCCLITIDNPPVNAIGQAVRQGISEALDAAEAAGVARIVITGMGKTFSAGADAREFGGPPLEPHLPDILARLERLPTIAAINGTALGGGLEVALACRMRIVAPEAKMGLPEVTLGVVPGAGGTQRLPRLVGIGAAASLVATGRQVGAEEAKALGLADELSSRPADAARGIDPAVLAACVPAAERPAPKPDAEVVAAERANVRRRARGQIAPEVALDLVAAAAELPIGEGLKRERAAFLELRQGEQAAALRHVFFAERSAASRSRRLSVAPAEIGSAVVVGGGTMGAGIAYALDAIGVSVTLVETDEAAASRATANLARLFDDAVKRGKSTTDGAQAGKARIRVQAGYDGLPPADLAIEAVFEDLDVKRKVFAALDAALPETAILATNTSYLDVNRVFDGIAARDRCIGLHFFSPAHVMKLLEVIRAEATSEATLATAFLLAARLKKVPVEAGVCDGFIGNRILTRYRQICDVMLIEGALPWEVDAAMVEFGMAMGPYAVQDLSGLDIAYANRKRKNLKADPAVRYIHVADRMVEDLRRLGRKTGGGWYDYSDGGKPAPSAEAEALILAASDEAGIERRIFTADEIRDRAVTAMIEEALHLLGEGIARTAADVDLVLVHGYGFPRWRGGPLFRADRIGLPVLLERIRAYAAEDPRSWSVPPLLEWLVAAGMTLCDFDRRGGVIRG